VHLPPSQPVPLTQQAPQTGPAPPAPVVGFTSGGFVTSAQTQASAAAGDNVQIIASVTSDTDRRAVVDVEIYSPDHQKLYQRAFEDEALTRGTVRSYDVPWKVPAGLATATVKIGIFTPGWAQLSHWNDDAATLVIQSRPG